ncbi:HAMP domain-containing histidine kinase [bacterium]|nr:MAG: HAMP domain-containing histidine kinase [bacterium]
MVSPVIENEIVKAVVVSDVSSQRTDGLIGTTLMRSLGIVMATVVLIVLLLLNHFRFVQYAMLFRRMKEVDQLKNDFLSVATHELRAPMTVIKGSIENLEDGITGTVDEKGRHVLKVIYGETERLNNLVTDLLNVSRLEQGRITYTFETVDLRETSQNIVDEFTAKAQQKGLTITYQQPPTPELISADKGRIIEVLTNLVDNAVKYSQKGSVIVTHKSTANQVVLSVRDTGIGMAAPDRERLFSRFYRIQNDDTKGIPGTGLGLWIIKQYIEAMRGTISVDSMVGVGTEFEVQFPRLKPGPEKP